MKKLGLGFLFLSLTLFLSGCVFGQKSAALQVNSIPKATVFLDGKNLGTTPLINEKLKQTEATLRLVPEGGTVSLPSWETKISLTSGAMAVVNWEFGETEAVSTGETLTLSKTQDKNSASLAVISVPDSAVVRLDGEAKGFTPLTAEKIVAGDREVTVSAAGFKERSIKAKLVNGYKLTINVKLAKGEAEEIATPSPSLTPVPTGSKAKVTPKPSPAKTTGPTPTPPERPYVEIRETPTGWLRVRTEPSTAATEAAKVNPGERYPLLDESGGWYKIKYDSSEGWISGKYAEKYE